jgi:hypothetical protein
MCTFIIAALFDYKKGLQSLSIDTATLPIDVQ